MVWDMREVRRARCCQSLRRASVTARITAFRPGQSPPPVRMPMCRGLVMLETRLKTRLDPPLGARRSEYHAAGARNAARSVCNLAKSAGRVYIMWPAS